MLTNDTGSTRSKPFAFAALALFACVLLFSHAPQARAQGEPEDAEGTAQQDAAPRRQQRPRGDVNLLLRLNLTQDQLARLREIRQQSEPEARALTRRLNVARRALDEAIYSDSLNEPLIEERAREVAAAQAALVRLRAQTELKVRRVLTPEQLQSFRELRQRARLRQRMQRRMNRRGDAPPPALDAPAQQPAPADNLRDTRPPRARRRRP